MAVVRFLHDPAYIYCLPKLCNDNNYRLFSLNKTYYGININQSLDIIKTNLITLEQTMNKVCTVLLLLAMTFISGCGMFKAVEATDLNMEAKVYIKYAKYDQAIELLDKSLDLFFELSSTHYWMAYCYEQKNNMSKALWEYELAVKYDPDMELAQKGYINALVKSGKMDEAIIAADNYFKRLNAPVREYMRIGKNYLNAGEEIFAARALEYAFHKSKPAAENTDLKKDVRPLLVLADYFKDKGDFEKERQYLMMAFQEDPTYNGIARRLGELGVKVNMPRKQVPQVSPLEQELRNLRQN